VHSLVLWSTQKYKQGKHLFVGSPTFSILSRYIERSVSAKLVKETLEHLKQARATLAPLSGAEVYAGVLFEAYAIRKLQAGGTVSLRRLCNGHTTETKELVVPMLTKEPITVGTNSMTETTVSFLSLRDLDESGLQLARLLRPTTTNFPTFDCVYIDETGNAWPTQMAIVKKMVLRTVVR
jgi:hypothetical protein